MDRQARIVWGENEDLFRQELERGHYYAERLADKFRAAGLWVEVTPLAFRNTIGEAHLWHDEHDMTVGWYSRTRIESKSRNLTIPLAPLDFEFDDALVYSKKGWKRKTRWPAAIVLISQLTLDCLVIPRTSEPTWTVRSLYDKKRNVRYDAYYVPKRRMRPFVSLLAWLNRREEELAARPMARVVS